MSVSYTEEDLPPEVITKSGKTWRREKFDTDSYQWVHKMEEDEYDWDPEEDQVSLVGTDTPIRVVSLQFRDEEWMVEGAETAGPDYHRPGFTELISSDFTRTCQTIDSASNTVEEFIKRLS